MKPVALGVVLVLGLGACQSIRAEAEQTIVVRHESRVLTPSGQRVTVTEDERIGVDRAVTKVLPGTLIGMAAAFSIFTALLAGAE